MLAQPLSKIHHISNQQLNFAVFSQPFILGIRKWDLLRKTKSLTKILKKLSKKFFLKYWKRVLKTFKKKKKYLKKKKHTLKSEFTTKKMNSLKDLGTPEMAGFQPPQKEWVQLHWHNSIAPRIYNADGNYCGDREFFFYWNPPSILDNRALSHSSHLSHSYSILLPHLSLTRHVLEATGQHTAGRSCLLYKRKNLHIFPYLYVHVLISSIYVCLKLH